MLGSIERFHDADKRSAVLQEQLLTIQKVSKARGWYNLRRRSNWIRLFPLGSNSARANAGRAGVYSWPRSVNWRHRREGRETMKISIVGILDRGVPNQERLHLRSLADVSLSSYAVFDTGYLNPGRISNFPKNVYWFAPKNIKAGDSVVVYTNAGVNSSTPNIDGTTTYFFHWGKSTILWSAPGSCAVVWELNDWTTTSR
jgi:hypothetical protein